jgi:hypothetical protein
MPSGPAQNGLDPWLVFRQDLAAYRHAIQNGDHEKALMFSNRFSSDALLFSESPDRAYLAFYGLLMRIADEDNILVQGVRDSAAPKDRRLVSSGDPFEVTDRFINALSVSTADPVAGCADVGEEFFKFETEISLLERDVHEQEAYLKKGAMGAAPRVQLTSFFIANQALLKQPQSRLHQTVGGEMARLSHLAIFDKKDLCFYTLFRGLSLVMEFVQFELRELSDDLRQEVLAWIDSFTPRFTALLQSLDNGTDAANWESTAVLSGELMLKWRQDWMRYGQLLQVVGAPQPAAGPKMSLSEELRQKRRPDHE